MSAIPQGAPPEFSLDGSDAAAFPVRQRIREALLLVGFCLFLFFYGLGQFGLLGADEPRYAQVAREMLERHDWITPTLAGKPWLEKPPLYYWQAIVAYRIFGVSDWAEFGPFGWLRGRSTMFIIRSLTLPTRRRRSCSDVSRRRAKLSRMRPP